MKKITEIQDDSHYKRIARQFIEEGRIFEAEKYVVKAFELNSSTENAILYANILFDLEKYEKALEIANKREIDFFETAEALFLYISILIEIKNFIKAKRLLDTKKIFLSSASEEKHTNLELKLYQEKEIENKKKREYKIKIKKELTSLSVKTVYEQLYWMEEARVFNLQDLREVSPSILTNPYVNVLARNSFLAYLIQYNDAHSYQMIWMDTQKEICPIQLGTLEENETAKTINNLLDELMDKNPSFYQLIKKEVNYHFLFLFPFIDETIPYPREWVQLYVEKYEPTLIGKRVNVHKKSKENFEFIHLFEAKYNQT
ncbi:hypothetical protein [Lacticigenium naphthae]|uniref:hypothetical protein n=1 Tax=Lacticigenium naphthae TaxID=515351 RepID=UPI00042714F3|nr:hypothetical protein [Lacticigenium naphthae]